MMWELITLMKMLLKSNTISGFSMPVYYLKYRSVYKILFCMLYNVFIVVYVLW